MAYIEIVPIKKSTHLQNAIDYINNPKKTNERIYTDSFRCGFKTAALEFDITRDMSVVKKGNNQAWHIIQSFAPDDNVTPEQALEIGKKLMKQMYPNYQYVIATHIDKDHIHNHIIMNSVNYKDYHKLNSNISSYYKMQKISDNLCLENGLSVIEKGTKNNRQALKNAIDEVVKNVGTYNDFLSAMQEKGYNIKIGKFLAFKNKDMKRYIRSNSISLDYSESAIRKRIESNKEVKHSKRKIYDDKINVRSLRKKLKVELDESIKKSKTYEEFISDMKRKKYEIKQGKHLAFKGNEQQRFIRCESIAFEYSEEVIKFRIENEERYKEMKEMEIERVYDEDKYDGGLYEWACGENSRIWNDVYRFVQNNVALPKENEFSDKINVKDLTFGSFLMEYNDKKSELEKKENQIKSYNEKMVKCFNIKKAIESYWRLKPIAKKYDEIIKNTLQDELSDREKEEILSMYEKDMKSYNESIQLIEDTKKEFGKDSISISHWNEMIKRIGIERSEVQQEKVALQLEFKNWENVRYNIEYMWNCTEEKAQIALDAAYAEIEAKREKQEKKEARKEKIKNILGFGR